ncbi:hypothetical protein M427DRAFT_138109 [Gonapodya prolifera JEL478]|uniref:Uncharacterized protein n=1 Tax=Gonapodya prolifera (strain JEL478) TaxID=1344416 RepID=A0A139A5D2_GONPJ|nr:hypothetical protein M427DRAFT_138109 [Gonapodya prolifera JEL478]|eukprot:KXS11675.1 hypothetical protein M427DRAFT_138109 [Gonapodya prolifera JEL478]
MVDVLQRAICLHLGLSAAITIYRPPRQKTNACSCAERSSFVSPDCDTSHCVVPVSVSFPLLSGNRLQGEKQGGKLQGNRRQKSVGGTPRSKRDEELSSNRECRRTSMVPTGACSGFDQRKELLDLLGVNWIRAKSVGGPPRCKRERAIGASK